MLARVLPIAVLAFLGLTAAASAALPVPVVDQPADTTLSSGAPTTPGGDATELVAGGDAASYLRFRVRDLPIPPQRAVLRLFVTAGSDEPTTVAATSSDWDEATVAHETRPTVVSGAFDTRPSVAAGTWAEYDITPLVVAANTFGVRIAGGATDPARFSSREGATAPQLRISTKDTLEELRWRLARPRNADAVRYQAKDTAGGTLDGLKIVEDRENGGYLGVWHAFEGDRFVSRVGTSPDLLTWQRRADLGEHDSQPAIARMPGGGAVVVSEADEPGGPHLRFRRFPTIAALLRGEPDATYDAPRTFAPTAEGTPHIRSVDAGADHVVVGFHYFRDADVDRQATGLLLGFREWRPQIDASRNALYEGLGVAGNLGDRDELTFRGRRFTLQEGQTTKGDFGTWRQYLEDQSTGEAAALPIVTAGASGSFGNGTATVVVAPSGRLALVATYFVFGPRSAPDEPGPMIFVSEYDDAPPPGVDPDPGVPPDTSPVPPLPTPSPAPFAPPPSQPTPTPTPTATPAATPEPPTAAQLRRALIDVLRAVPVARAKRSTLIGRRGRYRVRVTLPPGRITASLYTPGRRALLARATRSTTGRTLTLSLAPTARGRRALRAIGTPRSLVLRLDARLARGVSARVDRRVTLRR